MSKARHLGEEDAGEGEVEGLEQAREAHVVHVRRPQLPHDAAARAERDLGYIYIYIYIYIYMNLFIHGETYKHLCMYELYIDVYVYQPACRGRGRGPWWRCWRR